MRLGVKLPTISLEEGGWVKKNYQVYILFLFLKDIEK